MCNKVVSKETFMLKYCPDKYKTQKMWDKAVDSYLITLKFVPDWSVTNKILEKLDNFLFSKANILFHDVDFNIITFLSNYMGFNTIGLNIKTLTIILMKMIQKLLIMLDLWLGVTDLNNAKHTKKK